MQGGREEVLGPNQVAFFPGKTGISAKKRNFL